MLEDQFTDVLRKALAGLNLSIDQAANLAGISTYSARSFASGQFCKTTALELAKPLGLNASAFANLPTYSPKSIDFSAIKRIDLPFDDGQVNAWLIQSPQTSILFDTGFIPADLIQATQHLSIHHVWITHHHRDHVGAISYFLQRNTPVHAPLPEGSLIASAGKTVTYSDLSVTPLDLSGHATPALGYFIQGFSRPILVTGDALFAGSMGGCKKPILYRLALTRLRDVLSQLPADTILLPGHGPATTLAEELASNPFLNHLSK